MKSRFSTFHHLLGLHFLVCLASPPLQAEEPNPFSMSSLHSMEVVQENLGRYQSIAQEVAAQVIQHDDVILDQSLIKEQATQAFLSQGYASDEAQKAAEQVSAEASQALRPMISQVVSNLVKVSFPDQQRSLVLLKDLKGVDEVIAHFQAPPYNVDLSDFPVLLASEAHDPRPVRMEGRPLHHLPLASTWQGKKPAFKFSVKTRIKNLSNLVPNLTKQVFGSDLVITLDQESVTAGIDTWVASQLVQELRHFYELRKDPSLMSSPHQAHEEAFFKKQAHNFGPHFIKLAKAVMKGHEYKFWATKELADLRQTRNDPRDDIELANQMNQYYGTRFVTDAQHWMQLMNKAVEKQGWQERCRFLQRQGWDLEKIKGQISAELLREAAANPNTTKNPPPFFQDGHLHPVFETYLERRFNEATGAAN